jgi:hypothetical protein
MRSHPWGRRIVILVLTLAACTDPVAPVPVDLTGQWAGWTEEPDSVFVSLTLEDDAGNVSGSGVLLLDDMAFQTSIAGTYDGSAVALLIAAPSWLRGSPELFAGTVAADEVIGRLRNLASGKTQPLRLARLE